MLGNVTQPPAGLAERFSQIEHARLARAWHVVSAFLVLVALEGGCPTPWLPLIRFIPYTLLLWETRILYLCACTTFLAFVDVAFNLQASAAFYLTALALLYMVGPRDRNKLALFDLCLHGFLGHWVPWHLALWDIAWWVVDSTVAPWCRRSLALDCHLCSVGVDPPTMAQEPNTPDGILGVQWPGWPGFHGMPTRRGLIIPGVPVPMASDSDRYMRPSGPRVNGVVYTYCHYAASAQGHWPVWLQDVGRKVHDYRFGRADQHNHPEHPRTKRQLGVDTSGRLLSWPVDSGPIGFGGAVWPVGRIHVRPDTLLIAADYLVALEIVCGDSFPSGIGSTDTLLEVQGLTSAQPVRFAWLRGQTMWCWALGNTLIVVTFRDASCTKVYGDDRCNGNHLVAVPLGTLAQSQGPGSLTCVDGPWSVCLTVSARDLVLTDDQTVSVVCVGFESKRRWTRDYTITDTGLRGHDTQREAQSTGECIYLRLGDDGTPMGACSTPLTVPGVPWGVARVVLRAEAEAVRAALAGSLGSLPDPLVRLVTGYLYP